MPVQNGESRLWMARSARNDRCGESSRDLGDLRMKGCAEQSRRGAEGWKWLGHDRGSFRRGGIGRRLSNSMPGGAGHNVGGTVEELSGLE